MQPCSLWKRPVIGFSNVWYGWDHLSCNEDSFFSFPFSFLFFFLVFFFPPFFPLFLSSPCHPPPPFFLFLFKSLLFSCNGILLHLNNKNFVKKKKVLWYGTIINTSLTFCCYRRGDGICDLYSVSHFLT